MKKPNKNTQALLFLWFLILLSCLVVFRRFLFGDELYVYNDVGSDTMQQYLMHYNSIAHSIKDGTLSLWDFTNGFGTSMYALNLFHPLLFILYLIGAATSVSVIPYLLIYLEIAQIFLAATVFFYFLKEFPVSTKSRVIAAYIYGFNGYLLVWGQHYQFGLYVILFPLLLLLAEKALKKKKFSFLLSLTVAVSVLSSVYMSYMSLLTLGVYLLVRTISLDGDVKGRIRMFFVHCGSILLGIGMMMAVFLPSAAYTLSISSRLSSDVSLFARLAQNLAPFPRSFYYLSLYRMFSSNLNGIFDNYSGYMNYYEDPVLFIGILFVILLIQYVFLIRRQKSSLKMKLLQYLSIAFALFIVFTQIGSMVYNAFAYPFSRHTFVIMPFAALIIAFTLDQILIKKQISFLGIAVTLALFAFVYWKNPGTRECNTLYVVAMGILMMLVLVAGWQKKFTINPKIVSLSLLALVMVNMCYDSYYDTDFRVTLRKSDETYFTEMYGDDITSALNYLKETDPSFYRVEKDYYAGSFCMDSLGQDYFGVSSYNSTTNKNISEFIQKLWPNLQRMSPYMYSYQQTVYDTEMASLMNIKYLISHNPSMDADGFTLKKQFGSIYIYENQNTNALGKFFTKTISSDEMPEDTSTCEMGRFLSDHLIVDGQGNTDASSLSDYTLETIPYKLKNRTLDNQNSLRIPINQKKLSGYDRVYLDFTMKLSEYGILTVRFNDSSCYYLMGNHEEPVSVHLRVPKNCTEMTLTTETSSSLNGTLRRFTFTGSNEPVISEQAQISFDQPKKDTVVTGTIRTEQDGTLMVSIPYENGWHAYIDGKETTITRADYGFQAIPVTAGEHQLTFRYVAVGLKPGILVSVICCAGYLLLLVCSRRRRSYKQSQLNIRNISKPRQFLS